MAAMLDIGADEKVLRQAIGSIPADGFEVDISRVKKAGLDVCDFDVRLEPGHENHDHDMEYLFGKHSHDHTHRYETTESHVHGSETRPAHSHGSEIKPVHSHGAKTRSAHSHAHRGLSEVLDIIRHTEMTEQARVLAIRIFTILGQAEATAHGTTLEKVHFHEVGAVDSIVDIIAAAVCLDNLQVEDVIIPVLYEGYGKIRCQHGILPVPVPAVSNIIQTNHLNVHITDIEGELVTPTGAAIAAAIRTREALPEIFRIQKIGMGAGKREYKNPSILRAMLIEDAAASNTDYIYKLESNIDDCTGENLGYVLDRLMEAGARDVHYIPVYMKKNRPGYQLNVICDECDIGKMEEIIFAETTTIGIRRARMERTVMHREFREVNTVYGKAKIKICRIHETKKIYPEYNSVAELCRKSGKSFREVFQLIEAEGSRS